MMKKSFLNLQCLCLGIFLLFSSCSKNQDNVNDILQNLKEKQAKVLLKIDDKLFYQSESIFSGDVNIFENFFRMSLFDQFKGNVVVAFGRQGWYKQKPISQSVLIDDQISASVLIGKLLDEKKGIGEGYLMTEGNINVEAISDEKIILKITGKVGKYDLQRMPEKWNKLEGYIVYKKPKLTIQDVNTKDLFY